MRIDDLHQGIAPYPQLHDRPRNPHSAVPGTSRLTYATDHIEADNRLSWFLGRLDQAWGDRPIYVHLTRDPEAVAQSFSQRWGKGVIRAYHSGLMLNAQKLAAVVPPIEFCRDYVNTVTANIQHFLRDKTRVLEVKLETAQADYTRFWSLIGVEGDLNAALAEWDTQHIASQPAKQAKAR